MRAVLEVAMGNTSTCACFLLQSNSKIKKEKEILIISLNAHDS